MITVFGKNAGSMVPCSVVIPSSSMFAGLVEICKGFGLKVTLSSHKVLSTRSPPSSNSKVNVPT